MPSTPSAGETRAAKSAVGLSWAVVGGEERAAGDGGRGFPVPEQPTAESEDKNRDDGTHELKHGGDTTAAHPKTPDFSPRSEFLVATAI
jgi:hypothetical protein